MTVPAYLQNGDRLAWVGICTQNSSVLVASTAGTMLHFPLSEVRLLPPSFPPFFMTVRQQTDTSYSMTMTYHKMQLVGKSAGPDNLQSSPGARHAAMLCLLAVSVFQMIVSRGADECM